MRDRLNAVADPGPLPCPGRGATRDRFDALVDASRSDLGLGRLYEAHTDAQAILDEAGRKDIDSLGLLGVWASDRESATTVERVGGTVRLVGTKPFCSGAALLDHALVTARADEGVGLFLVDLSEHGVEIQDSTWVGTGMRSTDTRTVRLDGAPAVPVGATGWYLERAGFWHGAVGVAASWLGGALGVVDAMRDGVDGADSHHLALLGEAEAVRYSMEAALWRGADEIDAAPTDATAARARALRIRRVVAGGCLEIVARAGEALGPRALAFDEGHSQRIADLELYVRQEHGRHDSEQIGRDVVETRRARKRC
jgi:alkylation response protein AidB-like acyl-CoA dehydrogenase